MNTLFYPLGRKSNRLMASLYIRCTLPYFRNYLGSIFLIYIDILGHCHCAQEIYIWLDCSKGTLGPSRAKQTVHFQFAYIFQKTELAFALLTSYMPACSRYSTKPLSSRVMAGRYSRTFSRTHQSDLEYLQIPKINANVGLLQTLGHDTFNGTLYTLSS